MSKHDKFILTPITTVLNEAVVASSGIGAGIETLSISDYVMQSLFLKMTGFQEQKMKCISWEMATNDFDYRKRVLSNEDGLGEHSSYKAKDAIFKNLQEVISNIKSSSDSVLVFNEEEKEKIRDKTIDEIITIFNNSNLAVWQERGFNYFVHFARDRVFQLKQFIPEKQKNQKYFQLFQTSLKEKYEVLYRHRNRLAHNVVSYQDNLPTLKTLHEENEDSRNYFVWFAILVLIDKIFIKLYNYYQMSLEEEVY